MKRAPIVIVATAAGLVGVLGFHPSTSPTNLTGAGTKTSAPQTPQTSPPKPTNTSSGSSGATNPPTTTTTAPPQTGPSGIHSATGKYENYGYGTLAVNVTVSGNKITGLNLVGFQAAESYSQQIANQVIPILRNEVLSAQSLQVNGMSGATYTTEAYLYSIQSALDKLHVK